MSAPVVTQADRESFKKLIGAFHRGQKEDVDNGFYDKDWRMQIIVCHRAEAVAELVDALATIRKCFDIIDASKPFQYMHAMEAMRTCADAALAKHEGQTR